MAGAYDRRAPLGPASVVESPRRRAATYMPPRPALVALSVLSATTGAVAGLGKFQSMRSTLTVVDSGMLNTWVATTVPGVYAVPSQFIFTSASSTPTAGAGMATLPPR